MEFAARGHAVCSAQSSGTEGARGRTIPAVTAETGAANAALQSVDAEEARGGTEGLQFGSRKAGEAQVGLKLWSQRTGGPQEEAAGGRTWATHRRCC